MMRVLVAQIPMPTNRFLVDLNAALSKGCDLTHSSDDFWEMRGEYDLIHFHHPEYSTFAMQDAYTNGLNASLIGETEKRLRFWAERSRLVVTRHNHLPHDAVKDPRWEKIYEMFYRHVDGVAHFATASVAEFSERYRHTPFCRNHEPLHKVIPHHNYGSLPNQISRKEARQNLRIGADSKVMLVFGAIRNFEERDLILRAFRGLNVSRKLLLVSRWREQPANVSWIRLRNWLRDLTRLYYRLHPAYHFNYGFVEEAETQIYLNAADVLFIPRFRVLNSGNITLGMTFGRVVVGPDSWDVGELLRDTGNPVFDPARPETAAAAVEEGFRLAAKGRVGPANQQRALRDWSADRCAADYLKFYQALLAKPSLSPAAHAV
jgi:glycosyltransferase involved in cell wall biosynthesis